jgi:oligoendopeptidase F
MGMYKKSALLKRCSGIFLTLSLLLSINASAQQENEQIRWDLSELFPSDEDWNKERERLLAAIPDLEKHKGQLGKNAKTLQQILDEISAFTKAGYRMYIYASMTGDEDLRNSDAREKVNQASTVFAQFSQATSWINPEILSIGSKKIEQFIRSNKGLEKHAIGLRDTLRQEPHTLGPEAEQVMANNGEVLGGASSSYSLLANAAIQWPQIEIDGETITLDQAAYSKYRATPDRAVRKQVFDTFWAAWSQFEAPFGQMLDTHVKGHIFNSKSRKYDSTLEAATSGSNIPTTVYKKLVENVNTNLPSMHRYLKLRQRMLGLEDMHYYDIYPATTSLEKEFSLNEAKQLTLDSLQPFGDEYLNLLKKGFAGNWMHVYPQPGKRPGAYMQGSAYDVHPYVLLNFNKGFEDVSTFSHEWGHAVHSMLSKQNNAFENYFYSTFTAEMASTTNEVLLQEFLFAKNLTDEERLYYIDRALEGVRGTFFRQTMFAEFELTIHEMAEKGEPLSGKKMSEVYLGLLKKYHGHDQGVMNIDPAYAIEWAYIPHFYRNYYVYQYATSITGGTAFAERMRLGDKNAGADYLNVLKAGGSQYPYQLLKNNGIDLADDGPYKILMARMNRLMDEAEGLLDKLNR